MDRKQVTLRLKRAATYYMVDKGFSVYDEVGLKSGKQYAKLRADLLATTTRGHLTIIEVKSCWQDYTSDTKWESYLEFCNQMLFIITEDLWSSKHGQHIAQQLKAHGVGLLVLSDSGQVRSVQNSRRRKVSGITRRWLITKLAWRGGYCKATMDKSMRFNISTGPDREINLLEFLTMSKSDRSEYINRFPRCGFKKYLNYPLLNSDSV